MGIAGVNFVCQSLCWFLQVSFFLHHTIPSGWVPIFPSNSRQEIRVWTPAKWSTVLQNLVVPLGSLFLLEKQEAWGDLSIWCNAGLGKTMRSTCNQPSYLLSAVCLGPWVVTGYQPLTSHPRILLIWWFLWAFAQLLVVLLKVEKSGRNKYITIVVMSLIHKHLTI